MKIRDKNGNWIEVTDLKKAIQQTGWYKEYTHNPPVKATRKGRHIGQICTRN
jgi:hypothetical protein